MIDGTGDLTQPPGSARHNPQYAGFVLAGGRSSRMGRDKALLPYGDSTLLQQVAARVQQVVGNVTVIGSPSRYAALGLPVAADLVEGLGPMGGLYTALTITTLEWNLLVACDLPGMSAQLLNALLNAAETCGRPALVPESPRGREPLCAVYHKSLVPQLVNAIDHKLLKMQDFVSRIGAAWWPVSDASAFQNVNTPEEWAGLTR